MKQESAFIITLQQHYLVSVLVMSVLYLSLVHLLKSLLYSLVIALLLMPPLFGMLLLVIVVCLPSDLLQKEA